MTERPICQTKNQPPLSCYRCGTSNLPKKRFCSECGIHLDNAAGCEKKTEKPPQERKYLTVLFSDLSGYTELSTRLDPEETKEIMNQIFGKIARVITSYEGFIEKFIGDAVMALFGVPNAHEDDPVRAILAARHIHQAVAQLEGKIGHRLSMHSGISTGLVITGAVNLEQGTHGISGDTINLAARLEDIAPVGEILVDQVTCRQAEEYFTFDPLKPISVKGRNQPIKPYRVLAPKERPRNTRQDPRKPIYSTIESETNLAEEENKNARKNKSKIEISACSAPLRETKTLKHRLSLHTAVNGFQKTELRRR